MSIISKSNEKHDTFYLILMSVFISCLVTSNLIFLKFFSLKIDFLNIEFNQSVGLISYPITFLITDIVSEIYGKKKANNIVIGGIFASLIAVFIVYIASILPAAVWSIGENKKVDDATFDLVFGQFGVAMVASLFTYLVCQLVDIKIFHYLKEKFAGRKLWFRNNISTITSQIIDTFLILFLLMIFLPSEGLSNFSELKVLFINGFLFKLCVALFDTLPLYIIVYLVKGRIYD